MSVLSEGHVSLLARTFDDIDIMVCKTNIFKTVFMVFVFLFHRASHFSRRHFHFSHWAFYQATWSLFSVLKYPRTRT